MPPEKAARGQLGLASICLSTENRRSRISRVTSICTWRAAVLPEDEIHNDSDLKDEKNTANMEDDLCDGQGDVLSNILSETPTGPKPTMQSEIASMQMMMEE